jgi:hypothetical protein
MGRGTVNQRGRLRPGQRSARYWRLRFADDTAQRLAESRDELIDDRYDDDDDYAEVDLRQQALDRVLGQLGTRIRGAMPFNALPFDPRPVEWRMPARSEEPLEVRIVEHLERLVTQPLDAWLDEQTNTGLREFEAIADQHFGGQLARSCALVLFQPFWLRSPSSFRPSGASLFERMASLLEHLLLAYPTPRFLYAAASNLDTLAQLRWLAYLVVLGQGGSLRRLTELASRRWPREWAAIPQKLVGCLWRVDERLSPRDGLMAAEVLRLGGSEVEYRRLAGVAAFMMDPSSSDDEPGWLEFWRATVGWLVRHRDALDDESATAILIWARHMQIEFRRAGLSFSWRGRAVASALREATAYRQSWYQPRSRSLSWRHHGLDWAGRVDDDEWSICELTTSAALLEESRAMSHCVRGYDHACFQGRTAIFSLRQAGCRRVTIEMHLRSKRVVQAKRAFNAEPSAVELSVIERWITST